MKSAVADRICELHLGQLEVAHQLSVALCFFDRVEIRALEILDQCEREERAVVDVFDDGGDLGPADPSGGTHAASTWRVFGVPNVACALLSLSPFRPVVSATDPVSVPV